jgi:hypothetical protein
VQEIATELPIKIFVSEIPQLPFLGALLATNDIEADSLKSGIWASVRSSIIMNSPSGKSYRPVSNFGSF